MLFSMIVAHDLDYIIGQDDKLAWKSKEDLSWFVRKTKNKAIVMGSTTAKGIGRALPGRAHYVLTSSPGQFENIPELLAYSSFEDIAVDASRKGYNEIVICGGVSIYKQLLDRVQKLYVTEIPIRSKGNVPLDIDLIQELSKLFSYTTVHRGWTLESHEFGENEGCRFSTFVKIQNPITR